jgi:glycosyltransferase involved in cell wall biosynthesis
MDLSVVSPAHNEAANLEELLQRLSDVLGDLDLDWEIVLVDDGSTDATWQHCVEAAGRDRRIRGLRLSRNFGHQVAITAGLEASEGSLVITMDSDLQHPPEAIPALLRKAGDGYEVVYAIREEAEGEGWFKRRSADLFYRLLGRMTSLDLPHGGADFRLMSRRVVDALLAMPERNRFLRGMTRWVGYEQTTITYRQPLREQGSSKYTLRHMVRFAWDAIASFSAFPLRMASVLGFVVSGLGALYLAYVLGAFFFTDWSTAGWTSTVGALLVLSGVQLICLGLIGQYLGRMYDEVKGRPLFLIAEETGGRPEESGLEVEQTPIERRRSLTPR